MQFGDRKVESLVGLSRSKNNLMMFDRLTHIMSVTDRQKKETETDRQTDRQTDTDRQTETDTDTDSLSHSSGDCSCKQCTLQ